MKVELCPFLTSLARHFSQYLIVITTYKTSEIRMGNLADLGLTTVPIPVPSDNHRSAGKISTCIIISFVQKLSRRLPWCRLANRLEILSWFWTDFVFASYPYSLMSLVPGSVICPSN